MIPRQMKAFLEEHLPASALASRVIRETDGRCRLELGHQDQQLLACIGITADKLGPYLVAILWDEAEELEVGGYLVVDNLSMGSPSMGGIRMLAELKPLDIHNLARGMTLKNGAANLPYGGGKSGIVAPDRPLSQEEHDRIVRAWARLIRKYTSVYVPGPDVGTNDSDMRTVAMMNGMDCAVSKPADLGGNRIDELGGAAGGVVIALQTLLEALPRLRVLPQFADLQVPEAADVTVMFQGFGAVGAHAARIMGEPDRLPQAVVVGLSDRDGYLHDPAGLPVDACFDLWRQRGLVSREYFATRLADQVGKGGTKFGTNPNDLLREDAFCLVPASAMFNYLGLEATEGASMLVASMGGYRLVVEGANTYSPDPLKKALRARMEQVVYKQKGVMIANDYLVNSGGVIFAAQEHIVPTPAELQIPEASLGDPAAVQGWLDGHAEALAELSERRRQAGEAWREKVIRTNMLELVDLLAGDPNLLPCQAAERVSLGRLKAREEERTAGDLMIPIASVALDDPLGQAAMRIVESGHSLAAVVDAQGVLAGVINTWDIAQAVAGHGDCAALTVAQVMTRRAVTAAPGESIPAVVARLEEHRISALPVVEEGKVLGLINSDLLASRYLPRLLGGR